MKVVIGFLGLLLSSSMALCQAASPSTLPTCKAGQTPADCKCQPAVHRPAAHPKPKVVPKPAAPPAQPASPPAQPTQMNQQVAITPTDLSAAINIFAEIKKTDQQLLLLKEQNDTARMNLVEVPAQGTNQFRAQTERELADQQEVDDGKLTDAKVGLMRAQGRAVQVDAWGNLIGAGLSPLTSWLGRTQISTITDMTQGPMTQTANPNITGPTITQNANPTITQTANPNVQVAAPVVTVTQKSDLTADPTLTANNTADADAVAKAKATAKQKQGQAQSQGQSQNQCQGQSQTAPPPPPPPPPLKKGGGDHGNGNCH